MRSRSEAKASKRRDLERENGSLRGQLALADKQRREVLDENENLRGLLHRAELKNAQLEGYRDRVLEFDPVPDRQAYEDNRLDRGMPPRRVDYSNFDMASERQPAPWYRRG